MDAAKFASSLMNGVRPNGVLTAAGGDRARLLSAFRHMADRTIPTARLFLVWGPRGSAEAFDLGTKRDPRPRAAPPGSYPLAEPPPPGDAVLVRMDRWPLRRLRVETFVDGRRFGHLRQSPSIVDFTDGRVGAAYWMDGVDVTSTITRPAETLAHAAAWPEPFSAIARAPARMLWLVAAAEEDGLAVAASNTVNLHGPVAFSPGRGRPYELVGKDDLRRLCRTDLGRDLLRLAWWEAPPREGEARGTVHAEAFRFVGGLPDGASARAPAVATLMDWGDGGGSISERYFERGRRIGALDEFYDAETDVDQAPVP